MTPETPWVFDLDGTLLLTERDPRHWSAQELSTHDFTPRERACQRVRELHEIHDVHIVYCTGRVEHARATTRLHLAGSGLPPGPLFMLPASIPFNWPVYVGWKASIIQGFDAPAYVGNNDHDAEAADLAGAHFVHIDDFVTANLSELFDRVHDHADQRDALQEVTAP